MKTCLLRLPLVSCGFAAALAVTSTLPAQTPPATKPAAAASAEGDPVVLPEFNVAGSEDGWVATNALSGTRTNMNLQSAVETRF